MCRVEVVKPAATEAEQAVWSCERASPVLGVSSHSSASHVPLAEAQGLQEGFSGAAVQLPGP